MVSPAQSSRLIRFGPFELDAMNGELRKAGVSLKMHPQPLQVLKLLAEHAGQAVTREEIRHCLWGENTFVDFERGLISASIKFGPHWETKRKSLGTLKRSLAAAIASSRP